MGVYFGLDSQSQGNTAAHYRATHPPSYCGAPSPATPDCGPWNDAVQAQNREATVSNVLYVAGGVLAAGAIVTWFVWPKAHVGSAWVTPVVGPTGVGVSIGNRF